MEPTMKFTGVYAKYYQDICKQWDKVVAKCRNLEKNEPSLHNFLSDKIKRFNKEVDDFNGTTFVNDKQIIVNGVTKNVGAYIMSETFAQIRCIYMLKYICFEVSARYYGHNYYSVITSWDDYDALICEIEKEYVFIQEMLQLYAAELRNTKRNQLGAVNTLADIRNGHEHTKGILKQTDVLRRRSSPEFKRYSGIAVAACLECYKKSNSRIMYQHYYL